MPDSDVVISATVTNTPWDGVGTQGNPYLISTTDHLDFLAEKVNGGMTMKGFCFRLNNDIAYDYAGLGENGSNCFYIYI